MVVEDPIENRGELLISYKEEILLKTQTTALQEREERE